MEPLRQEPEAPCNNATSRELHRIPPPAGAGDSKSRGSEVLDGTLVLADIFVNTCFRFYRSILIEKRFKYLQFPC